MRHSPVLLVSSLFLFLSTGLLWAAPNVRLTNDPGSSVRPRICFDPSNNVVVVWQDDRYGNNEILWQKFDHLGNPLTVVVRVTNTSGSSARPDVACDPVGNSHIAWQEGENVNGVGNVYMCRLDPSGAKVFGDLLIKDLSGDCRVSAPFTDTTDLFWHRFAPTDQDVYYHRYNSAGTRTCERRFNAGTIPGINKTPALCSAANGDAQLFWRDMTTSFQLHLRQGAATNSCAAGQAIAYNNSNATNPTTDAGGAYVFTLFEVGGNIYNFLGAPSACQLSQGSGTSTQPSVSADITQGYAAWRDTRDGNSEIFFARFFDCPSSTGDIRLTTDVAVSETPDIVVEESGTGRWIVAWSDGRDGNREIYLTSQFLLSTPAPPSGIGVALVFCPPRAAITWIDNSDNETGFQIEMEANGSGVWELVQAAPANATSSTSAPLEYGSSYAFRVRSCNGGLCSPEINSAPVPVTEPVLLREGIIRATVIERPFVSNPMLRPLPHVRVSILRDGQPVYSAFADAATGAYQIVATMRCTDQIGVFLDDDLRRIEVVDRATTPATVCEQAPVPSMVQPLGTNPTVDFTWPVASGGYSGDAPNFMYLVGRMIADYWEPHLQVGEDDWREFFAKVNVPHALASVTTLGSAGNSCGGFGPGVAKYKSAVLHEFGHRMVIQRMGLSVRQNESSATYPEAAGLDEGLADYFTAAYTGDPQIHSREVLAGIEIDWVLRNLSRVSPYTWCNGAYQQSDEYYGGRVSGGALWDLRARLVDLRGVDPYEVDHTVFGGLDQLNTLPVSARKFLAFRDILLATSLGASYSDDVFWAFDRHNIKNLPDEICKESARLVAVTGTLVPEGRQVAVVWTRVPDAASYRLFVRRFPASAMGIAAGELVADSLTDTTFTYVEPDTALILSYRVAAVDSSGDEGPSSADLPTVTAVPTSPEGRMDAIDMVVFPNPTRHGTRITLALAPHVSGIEVMVYDLHGRRVRGLWSSVGPSVHTVKLTWDGRSDHGSRVPAGVYFIKATTGAMSAWRRVVVVD